VARVLSALQTGKTLIVTPEADRKVYLSARNIKGVKIAPADSLNTYDVLNCDTLLLLQGAVAKIEEVYA
jgi:large subunit ribosomal protein L4